MEMHRFFPLRPDIEPHHLRRGLVATNDLITSGQTANYTFGGTLTV
jgi:hypothetical protein